MNFVTKGTRVRVSFLQADDPPGSLAGAQLKFTAKQFEFVGTVRHVRGDAPTPEACKDIRFWVEPDGPVPEHLRVEKCDRCGCVEVPGLQASALVGLAP